MYPEQPIPQEAGSLVPPPVVPPTAVAAATPGPEPRRVVRGTMHDAPGVLRFLGHVATTVLDALDEAGDAVGRRLGLREATREL